MRTAISIVALALLAGACGSSSGGPGPSLFLSAPNVPPMSGYIYGPPATPAVVPSPGAVLFVGDRTNDYPEYGYYRFDISAIPPGAVIEEAMFRVGQEWRVGSPYLDLGGQVLLDHVELGAALDPADYAPTIYAASVAVLSTSSADVQKNANVQSAVQTDVNAGRTHTDLRLRFPIGTDGLADWDEAVFNNQANSGGSGLLPLLEVRYHTP